MKKRMLIVYYSVSNGNTERIAQWLQKATDADVARIEMGIEWCEAVSDEEYQKLN